MYIVFKVSLLLHYCLVLYT